MASTSKFTTRRGRIGLALATVGIVAAGCGSDQSASIATVGATTDVPVPTTVPIKDAGAANTTPPSTGAPDELAVVTTVEEPEVVAQLPPVATDPESVEPIFEDVDAAEFSDPTLIDNEWLPLTPGNRLVLDGITVEEGEESDHRIVFVVTDLTKQIDGVETRVAWIEDYSDGELVEAEIAFYAQDDDGNVWFFGEYPEEYDEGELDAAPTWIAGLDDALAGVQMYADPEPGRAVYQGWGPAVEWSDFGRVESVGQQACVALQCFDDVLVIAESSLGEDGVFQLKSYAKGVGTIQVDFRGDDATQEQLEASEFGPVSDAELDEYRSNALAMDARAYEVSPDVYAQTEPISTPGP
jgi:hypothetical protein